MNVKFKKIDEAKQVFSLAEFENSDRLVIMYTDNDGNQCGLSISRDDAKKIAHDVLRLKI